MLHRFRHIASGGLSAPVLMILSTWAFASMALCVKVATQHFNYGLAEVIMSRGLVGVVLLGLQAKFMGMSLRTQVMPMHAWRAIFGVSSLALWFYALSALPLATAVTMNYMSSIWIAIFLAATSLITGARNIDYRLFFVVLIGFGGVVLVLRPSLPSGVFWPALSGLCSGMIAALAYLQVSALGRAKEPTLRTVFYFSLFTSASGAFMTLFTTLSSFSPLGALTLIGIGTFATLGQMLLTAAYTKGQAISNASLQYMGIAFSLLYGVLFFNEIISVDSLIGLGLIVGAGITASLLRHKTTAS